MKDITRDEAIDWSKAVVLREVDINGVPVVSS